MKKINLLIMCVFLISLSCLLVVAYGKGDPGDPSGEVDEGDQSESEQSTESDSDQEDEGMLNDDDPTNSDEEDTVDEPEDEGMYSFEDVSKEDVQAIGQAITEAAKKENEGKKETTVETPLGTATIDNGLRFDPTPTVSITFTGNIFKGEIASTIGVKW